MTADPEEGVDRDGFITTGADLANLRAPYDVVVADARDALRDALSRELHSLYLYGSVATGQAMAPDSDLDLAVIVATDAARQRCGLIGDDLSRRHRATVSEVGVSAGLLADVLAPGDAGRAERCFLKHYCVHLYGVDLRAEFPRCRPDRALARGFVGDLDSALERFRAQLQQATTPADLEAVAVTASRRLLMAAAVLHSMTDGTWTTDRTAGADMLARHHPDDRDVVALALRCATLPRAGGGEVRQSVLPARAGVSDLLERLGRLVAGGVRQHLTTPS